MRRRLFNLAAAVLLVLCVANSWLWVRSLPGLEQFVYVSKWHMESESGGF